MWITECEFMFWKVAKEYKESLGSGTRKLVEKEIYVANMLISCATEAERSTFSNVHKRCLQCLTLNPQDYLCLNVIEAFPLKDHAEGIKDLQLSNCLPTLCSLGVSWNVANNSFMFQTITSLLLREESYLP